VTPRAAVEFVGVAVLLAAAWAMVRAIFGAVMRTAVFAGIAVVVAVIYGAAYLD
jgi:hypothetical protein